ncbi:hypothetical protein [Pseudoalteromonas luteoviolacea]|uniref:Uncharacterized protein n=1 Tax=Pseudoalteromonas luteoviolacea H33 TaxID=1365251 RepID=A0A167AD42_9GAMM|nr:hypothetical protein [Pseudoalteromonas luteoviolacea]KZN45246.1 hypothetical protein N476_04345 [Pseudoalteromonas luteoviolacea H33]KZN70890.1 hypothetical protein N477_05695 [Pseudoalteromonas luteoviolacea H33-S]MBQ4877220.1 hypothetical protein [Pseudoalteromonas luteoviolacea]MBQ4906081.1 hypothetical protein [Pseudoalteromonas luteoviolacea]
MSNENWVLKTFTSGHQIDNIGTVQAFLNTELNGAQRAVCKIAYSDYHTGDASVFVMYPTDVSKVDCLTSFNLFEQHTVNNSHDSETLAQEIVHFLNALPSAQANSARVAASDAKSNPATFTIWYPKA